MKFHLSPSLIMMNPTYWEQWQFKSEEFSCCRASRIKYSGANCEVFEDDDNASVLVSFLHLFLREGKLIIAWASLTYDTCPKWHEHASFVKKYGKCDHFPKHETQWTKLFKISCVGFHAAFQCHKRRGVKLSHNSFGHQGMSAKETGTVVYNRT